MYWNRIHQNRSSGWGWIAFKINLVWYNLPFKYYPALTPNTIVMTLLLKCSLECGSLFLLDLLPRLENIMGFRNGPWTQFSRNVTPNSFYTKCIVWNTEVLWENMFKFGVLGVKWSSGCGWIAFEKIGLEIANSFRTLPIQPLSRYPLCLCQHSHCTVLVCISNPDFEILTSEMELTARMSNYKHCKLKKLWFWPRLLKLILVHLFWPEISDFVDNLTKSVQKVLC